MQVWSVGEIPKSGIAGPKNVADTIMIDNVKLPFIEVVTVTCIWKYLFSPRALPVRRGIGV